ncbi:fumarylacetoacetate hydrolase family protein [Paenibacillus sp.]|uniref:fumarylacetoacetate hydrolase family protein n=1 Tax=Paenibacillus sp. TaxID=58172 RepID=UPI002D22E7CE|nr:fumarylacetoacetate hydrolase family protein [Paenibacillus sp.]HZG87172.1 fumarylacetoacetate hydrolase family protein [Paenibacillus sp.]
MRFRPWQIVAFHSLVMTLLPGDAIMTGTPGAVVIAEGDAAECRIEGIGALTNPVGRLPQP